MNDKIEFLNDKAIAARVRFSVEWVRQQRHRRRHGLDHAFTVDPVMIGTKPRYRADEVEAWLDHVAKRGADEERLLP